MFPTNQGTQRHPSGAVGPSYNAGPPQLSPLPIDNGALPHDDPFLMHRQPNSGLNALHQFNNNSNGTPYHGHNPCPPFAYSDPPSNGPDQSLGLSAMIAQLLAEVQRLSESMNLQHVTNNQLLASNQQLENLNQQLVESNQQLTMHVEAIELIQAESKNVGKKKAGLKNVSNKHILLKKNEHVLALGTVKLLPNREPFEVTDDNKRIWHPNWLGKVDDAVNAKFIHNIVQHVWNNEKATKAHCQAAIKYEQETGNCGAVAMIDTNFALDIFSYSEDNLSDDVWKRCTEAEVGKLANMIVGHQCMKDSVTSNAGGPEEQLENEAAVPARKQTIPFKNMCFLDGVDWLKGFYSWLREEDLMKEDGKYLKELEEQHGEDSMDDETEPQTLMLIFLQYPFRVDKKRELGVLVTILPELP
ncbi:uncharacterized protein BJ212DRAFT_1297292 [Suillus subaureus]|uniref:Uncharacterized protein n=1 Tax=Suillus subaureus TaxID=48587 RepID=A0A9P7EIK3_9AGAM|nr:uncharacterized protein BJ212DRAFT_1297292 [Suillus subaureus]KAG1822043.1 hypothetical protein BJ212DRAFT_1297292 [Suillus subaureus]